jgi:hypothetical protein
MEIPWIWCFSCFFLAPGKQLNALACVARHLQDPAALQGLNCSLTQMLLFVRQSIKEIRSDKRV